VRWLIFTAIGCVVSATYLVIGAVPGLLRLSDGRRRKFHRSGVGLVVLTLACLAKYLTHGTN
jgi:hypothetical protein